MGKENRRVFNRRSALQTLGTGIVGALSAAQARAQADRPPETKTRALVLGGGSIKGAYQAGVIDALLKKGFKPDYLYGISVGSLNAAFLADRAFFLGKTKAAYHAEIHHNAPAKSAQGEEIVDWPFIGGELAAFWSDKVIAPKALVKEIDSVGNLFNVLTSNFEGLVSVGPLRELVGNTLKKERLVASPIPTSIGAVNIDTTLLTFAQKEEPYFREFIIASAAMPVAMPIVTIPDGPNKGRYCDGGARSILPIRRAADHGPANRLLSIACQPDSQRYTPVENPKNIFELLTRVSDIAADDITAFDTDYVARSHPGKVLAVIRPDRLVSIEINRPNLSITNFSAEDVKAMLDLGRRSAEEAIKRGDLNDGFLA